MKVQVSKDQMIDLIKKLSVLSKGCTDITIKNGVIRQKSDDGTTIYNVSVNVPIDARLQLAKTYIPVFKAFLPLNDDDYLEIEVDNDDLILSDSEGFAKFRMGEEKYMSASFIPDEKYRMLIQDKTCEFEIHERAMQKLLNIGDNFLIDTVEVKNDASGLRFKLQSSSKTKSANISVSNEPIGIDEGSYKVSFQIFTFPFVKPPIVELFSFQGRYIFSLSDGEHTTLGLMEKI